MNNLKGSNLNVDENEFNNQFQSQQMIQGLRQQNQSYIPCVSSQQYSFPFQMVNYENSQRDIYSQNMQQNQHFFSNQIQQQGLYPFYQNLVGSQQLQQSQNTLGNYSQFQTIQAPQQQYILRQQSFPIVSQQNAYTTQKLLQPVSQQESRNEQFKKQLTESIQEFLVTAESRLENLIHLKYKEIKESRDIILKQIQENSKNIEQTMKQIEDSYSNDSQNLQILVNQNYQTINQLQQTCQSIQAVQQNSLQDKAICNNQAQVVPLQEIDSNIQLIDLQKQRKNRKQKQSKMKLKSEQDSDKENIPPNLQIKQNYNSR